MNNIKITVGLGSIDDYIAYAKAGAAEVFIGFVPERWTSAYGILSPLNRREVLYYNVQIGSRSELEILHDMYLVYKVPVQIALNALYYNSEQYPLVVDIMKECLEIGFDSFIVADMGLLIYLDVLRKEEGNTDFFKKIHISISGELSEMNSYLVSSLRKLGANRIIFHRYVGLEEMKQMVSKLMVSDTLQQMVSDTPPEFEAFILNEKCHFNGAYCNSLHCDELCHMCQVPYKSLKTAHTVSKQTLEDFVPENIYIPGLSGCGLCSLWDLREAGITHLKVVGRGNYTDDMLEDIKALKKALDILESSSSKKEYIESMKEHIFPYGCSGECYYEH